MTWFLLALLVAAGGIFAFYRYQRLKAPVIHDPKDTGPVTGERINLNDPKDVERWTREFGVDEWDLKGAVQDAGVSAESVRKYLRDK